MKMILQKRQENLEWQKVLSCLEKPDVNSEKSL